MLLGAPYVQGESRLQPNETWPHTKDRVFENPRALTARPLVVPPPHPLSTTPGRRRWLQPTVGSATRDRLRATAAYRLVPLPVFALTSALPAGKQSSFVMLTLAQQNRRLGIEPRRRLRRDREVKNATQDLRYPRQLWRRRSRRHTRSGGRAADVGLQLHLLERAQPTGSTGHLLPEQSPRSPQRRSPTSSSTPGSRSSPGRRRMRTPRRSLLTSTGCPTTASTRRSAQLPSPTRRMRSSQRTSRSPSRHRPWRACFLRPMHSAPSGRSPYGPGSHRSSSRP